MKRGKGRFKLGFTKSTFQTQYIDKIMRRESSVQVFLEELYYTENRRKKKKVKNLKGLVRMS